ncbi:hypothetical protein DV735_g2713, partial [Chaetothyriales sp. CBS 134920]
MAKIFAYLHHLFLSVPQHGYHNISRVVQPQMRSISESFQVQGLQLSPTKKSIGLQQQSVKNHIKNTPKGKKAP